MRFRLSLVSYLSFLLNVFLYVLRLLWLCLFFFIMFCVFCPLVVLVQLLILAKWLVRKTPMKPLASFEEIISTKTKLKSMLCRLCCNLSSSLPLHYAYQFNLPRHGKAACADNAVNINQPFRAHTFDNGRANKPLISSRTAVRSKSNRTCNHRITRCRNFRP